MTDSFDTADASALTPLWNQFLSLVDPASRSLLTTCRLTGFDGVNLTITVPNQFTSYRIDTRLRDLIEQAASDYFQTPVHLELVVDASLSTKVKPLLTNPLAPPLPLDEADLAQSRPAPMAGAGAHLDQAAGITAPSAGHRLISVVASPDDPEAAGRLNPRYTFDTFVIGPNNRFAHAAAVAVAETPGKSYNPLMIYGASGLGKTHLLHAIGHYIGQYQQRLKVKYVSTEEMTNDFINSIQNNQTAHFRALYREVDVLLIDDIQFLESRIQTQEEFFHTFNTLHNAQKQIVMTSDRPPRMLEALEPRLRSRFEWGLLADITPADLETRIAILRKKAAAETLDIDPEVLEFIATNVQANIRELEGSLIRVTAFASLNRQPINLSLAEIVLKDLIADGDERQISPPMIMAETASYFTLTVDDLIGANRTANVALARQVAMYLCRDLTELSLPKIGALFNRDHTTVMHACRKIQDMMTKDRGVFNTVAEITTRLRNQAAKPVGRA
ncbi:MAG: chromosomal replication initiator protein DnaA [Propionibacteriaceae bacterium]|jgi:chromosomal replication initiator protein|nr:chromosomal replication initiator protein DnaA [Propionibacteriaceae bacterium]